jgi:hypothetical protein
MAPSRVQTDNAIDPEIPRLRPLPRPALQDDRIDGAAGGSREGAPDPGRADHDYEALPPVDSPEFELMARE